MGRIFDDRGNRMSPSLSRSGGARYRYYILSALIQGQRGVAGSVARVPAAVEAVVVDAVRRHIDSDMPINTLFSARNTLFGQINSLLGAKRFPVPVFRELYCNLLI